MTVSNDIKHKAFWTPDKATQYLTSTLYPSFLLLPQWFLLPETLTFPTSQILFIFQGLGLMCSHLSHFNLKSSFLSPTIAMFPYLPAALLRVTLFSSLFRLIFY